MLAAHWVWFAVIGLSALFATSLWTTIIVEILKDRGRQALGSQQLGTIAIPRMRLPESNAMANAAPHAKLSPTAWTAESPRIAGVQRTALRDKSAARAAVPGRMNSHRELRRPIDRQRFIKGSPDRPINV